MRSGGDFLSKTVMVTGGTSGIGRALAAAFAEAGANVALCGRDADRTAAATKELSAGRTAGAFAGIAADMRIRKDAERFVTFAAERFGGIDALVNAAGVAGAAPSEDVDERQWDLVLDTNLKGTFLACQAAAHHMFARGGGAILNIGSIAGLGAFPRRAAYSASKAAVGMLTQVLACEWADRSVRVNAIAPGVIRTPLNERMIADGNLDLAAIQRRTPAGRRGETDDLVGAALFLASSDARFVTGVILPVDGGWSAYGYL